MAHPKHQCVEISSRACQKACCLVETESNDTEYNSTQKLNTMDQAATPTGRLLTQTHTHTHTLLLPHTEGD